MAITACRSCGRDVVRFGARNADPTGKSLRFIGSGKRLMSSLRPENIVLPFFGKICCLTSVPLRSRGALRGRHERWRRDAVDVSAQQASAFDADGEIVRSRSPDAEIKSCGTLRKATAARKPGTPRRPRISRKTIARGMPVVSAEPVLLACAKCTLLCTQGSRVRPASGIPCALRF
jgi:hypothetical protein